MRRDAGLLRSAGFSRIRTRRSVFGGDEPTASPSLIAHLAQRLNGAHCFGSRRPGSRAPANLPKRGWAAIRSAVLAAELLCFVRRPLGARVSPWKAVYEAVDLQ